MERELAWVRLQAVELDAEIDRLGGEPLAKRLEAVSAALEDLLEHLERLSPGLSVAQVAERLGVSIPTVKKWLKEDLLERVPDRSPIEVTPESVVRVEGILDRVREAYPAKRWTRALAAYLHDQDVQDQDWFKQGVESLRRGERVKV